MSLLSGTEHALSRLPVGVSKKGQKPSKYCVVSALFAIGLLAPTCPNVGEGHKQGKCDNSDREAHSNVAQPSRCECWRHLAAGRRKHRVIAKINFRKESGKFYRCLRRSRQNNCQTRDLASLSATE